MSLLDRVVTEGKGKEAKKAAKGVGQFKSGKHDSYSHTDPWKRGRRNLAKGATFQGSNRRYPVGTSYAGALATWRQALARGGPTGKIKSAIKKKWPEVCLKGDKCHKDRDHGEGGPPEHKTACKGKGCGQTKKAPEHPGLDDNPPRPWPFNHGGERKWDPDWTALGGEQGKLSRKLAKKAKREKKGKKKLRKAGKKVQQAVAGLQKALAKTKKKKAG